MRPLTSVTPRSILLLLFLHLLHLVVFLVVFPTTVGFFVPEEASHSFRGLSSEQLEVEDYCSRREGDQCCPGRDDTCTVPFLDTVCYCDIFCNRTLADCCPDFLGVCFGAQPLKTNRPPGTITNNCFHEGQLHDIDDEITVNCNNCTCVYAIIKDEYNWKCTQRTCLIRPQLLNYVNVNATSHGWSASNYSFLWGMTLDEGIRRRLGTRYPSAHITSMSVLKVKSKTQTDGGSNLSTDDAVPEQFDGRHHWRDLISPVLDQGNCAASWAFSTAGVASDRLHIHSSGVYNQTLSPQHLVSCNTGHGQHGCDSGHIDRAWWFIRKIGIVSKDCLRYASGLTQKAGSCPLPRSQTALRLTSCPSQKAPVRVFHATPPYRISPNEEDIKKELMENGPLQVVMEVKEDFYMYKSGVYRHSLPADYLLPSERQTNFHSIRLIGWGIDNKLDRPLKYWLCANSWGTDWGEDGFFRILRGTDESRIESFVVGAWLKVDERTLVMPRNGSSISRWPKHRRSWMNRPGGDSV